MRFPRTSISACASVNRDQHAFQPETADGHPVADYRGRCSTGSRRRRGGRFDARAQPLGHFLDGGLRLQARGPGIAGRETRRRRLARHAIGEHGRALLQVGHHGVDLAARLAHAVLDAVGDLAAELLFAFLECLVPLAELRFRRLDRLTLARERRLLAIQRAHVIVHACQMVLQLRVPRADLLPRRHDDRLRQARGAPQSPARGCGRACRTSAGTWA